MWLRGRLWAWGRGDGGRLGLGNEISLFSPTLNPDFPQGTAVRSAAAGGLHSLAVSERGELFTWGYGGFGVLGHGEFTRRDVPCHVAPSDWLEEGVEIKSAAAGGSHTLGLSTDGRVYAWGRDEGEGRLGIPHIVDAIGEEGCVPRPIPVEFPASQGLPRGGVSLVACGGFFSAAVDCEGGVWTWGGNHNGELGQASSGLLSARISTITAPVTHLAASPSFESTQNEVCLALLLRLYEVCLALLLRLYEVCLALLLRLYEVCLALLLRLYEVCLALLLRLYEVCLALLLRLYEVCLALLLRLYEVCLALLLRLYEVCLALLLRLYEVCLALLLRLYEVCLALLLRLYEVCLALLLRLYEVCLALLLRLYEVCLALLLRLYEVCLALLLRLYEVCLALLLRLCALHSFCLLPWLLARTSSTITALAAPLVKGLAAAAAGIHTLAVDGELLHERMASCFLFFLPRLPPPLPCSLLSHNQTRDACGRGEGAAAANWTKDNYLFGERMRTGNLDWEPGSQK
ncbi:unnamed protein product [Closterium sp. NIES-65]|nr:unnamed protein product [Closterium sp. NIES-65]